MTWMITRIDQHNSEFPIFEFSRENWRRVDFNRVPNVDSIIVSFNSHNRLKIVNISKLFITRNGIIKMGYNEFCLSLLIISVCP